METDEKCSYNSPLSDHWCPLFSPLPNIHYNPGSSINRCGEVILAARNIWEVDHSRSSYNCARYCEKNRDGFRPVPEELPEYSVSACLSACTAGMAWKSLLQEYSYPRTNPLSFEEDRCVSNQSERFRWDMAAEDLRYSNVWGYFDDAIPDFAIIAGFALCEAWGVLENVLSNGAPDADQGIMKDVKMAEDLLFLAISQEQQE